jgi:hypothetical protein
MTFIYGSRIGEKNDKIYIQFFDESTGYYFTLNCVDINEEVY